MFKGFKITCNQATTICNKSQYGDATLLEKFKLQIHFIGCKICPIYSKQNILLTKIIKQSTKDCKKHKHCMKKSEKTALKTNLEKF